MDQLREQVRQAISEELPNVLKEFLDKDIRESHDDYDSNIVGKVVNNKDPKKLGRCRVRIFGIHGDAIQDSDLPWAIPDFGFVGSKVGSFIVPPVGTMVGIYFDKGDPYLPHYTNKVLDLNNLPDNKNENYPNNMIFYQTDNGDYYTINRTTRKTTLHHSSGTEITIDLTGKVTISAWCISIPHKATGTVAPDPTGGPFNALPIDIFTGTPHQGTTVING
jgi:hypothetical protein